MAILLAIFALALSACGTPSAPSASLPAAAAADPGFAVPSGQDVLRIVPEASLVAITVRRSGPLARMGHDHVVAARRIEGYAAPAQGHAALRFRLDQLTVDEPALRREAGLASQPAADAIDGTRRNMLGKVLQAESYPWLLLRAEFAPGRQDLLRTEITLHGVSRQYWVAVDLRQDKEGLTASGAFTLKQSDFGITPFAVLGGALAVKDELELRFAISARR